MACFSSLICRLSELDALKACMARSGSGSSRRRGHRAPEPSTARRPCARVSGRARRATVAGSPGLQRCLLTATMCAAAGAVVGASRFARVALLLGAASLDAVVISA